MVTFFFCSDEEKPGSAKKRRKSASGTPLSRVGSPGTTPFKPAMTERQQMALLLQMTDPNKQHTSEWYVGVSYYNGHTSCPLPYYHHDIYMCTCIDAVVFRLIVRQ